LANILDKFGKTIVGKRESAADYTPVLSPSGDFSRITNINAIINCYNTILMTPTGTYDHDPTFGCDLYKYIFSPIDDSTMRALKRIIIDQLLMYESRANIVSLNIYPLPGAKKGFSIDLVVSYNDQTESLNVTIDDSYIVR